MKTSDLSKDISSFLNSHPDFDEKDTDYLLTFSLLGKVSASLLDKDLVEMKTSLKKTLESFIPYFSKRFPSISISSYTKSEVIDFVPSSLLFGAFKEFSSFVRADKKLPLMELISSYRYLLTLEEII